ncbi:hypothetical protein GUJ93_ZPchr0010g8310 [Zizania palustris]|uniref:Uncharacterized protein n=1 Tax=Zizania palustris TaxID=103762 RepID=A0A8J5WFF8_ZIZPA|nr:hypothetical protein GUJ93_ZPchr0010g8310 [Zizania palustris]
MHFHVMYYAMRLRRRSLEMNHIISTYSSTQARTSVSVSQVGPFVSENVPLLPRQGRPEATDSRADVEGGEQSTSARTPARPSQDACFFASRADRAYVIGKGRRNLRPGREVERAGPILAADAATTGWLDGGGGGLAVASFSSSF